ncbi:pleckstrin homology domain-containing family J member 1-like [Amphibalanus amphitrite]|uniref:pleckstrin homology domain-containing family J member 1-like n=1 Tax=Amphibalanus amphitrite TaxID=1232801 RepID=UPI001C903AD2|nr:pleckstrin homology domain-containing family J member 1-like [Amphibalanus amphitrite]XP_043209195.1 pleckstrin homology domain-containing family J member 1-like [Amphibalanus amphitrite]XP_043209196.1 pleckstrin homology domain-containing family J member 1-like [Amphibalanus amphitrite]
MRSNAKDMAAVAEGRADLEGRLSHKPPRSGLREERTRERWFKLRHNLLFYYRLNEYGGVSADGPAGLFVLENVHVQPEPFAEGMSFCFSLTFDSDRERRHLMACVSAAAADQWVAALRAASYESRRKQLKELRSKLLNLTGRDPLRPFPGARALKNVTSVEEDRSGGRPRSSWASGKVSARDATFRSHLIPNGGAQTSSLLD